MTKISIIVPVYNAEKYLCRCLDSIVAQTFTDWECILVDDGSLDNSGTICDKYVAKDKRFKVIHKINGGVSSARNVGIEIATGEWLAFVDSDDWLYDKYLSSYVKMGLDSAEHFIQGFSNEYRDFQKIVTLGDYIFTHPSEVICYLEIANNVHNGFIWHRIYRRSIIKQYNIQFPEDMSYAEDGLFNLSYLKHIRITRIIPSIGYHYNVGTNGLTFEGKKQKDIKTALIRLDRYSSEIMDIIVDCNDQKKISDCIGFLWRLAISWVIKKNIESYVDYKIAHFELNNWAKQYKVIKLYRSFECVSSYLLFFWLTHSRDSKLGYKISKILMFFYDYEIGIKNKI